MIANGFLTRMWAGLLQARIESGRRSLERFQAHGAGNISDMGETFRAQDRQSPHGMHRVCPVEQSESFLCLYTHRLQPSEAQCFESLHSMTLKKRFAFANQALREMGERSEIATGADRTF